MTGRRKPLWPTILATLCCAVQAILLCGLSYEYSPTEDEPAHIASGITHWRHGTFDAYRVNPPLVRMLATLPILPLQPSLEYSSRLGETPYSRNEFVLGRMFLFENASEIRQLVFLSRLTCIPFVLLGGVVCYLWGSKLYGPAAGLFSMVMWTVCPNILGHGCLVTTDVAAASTGVFASYAFWLWTTTLEWKQCYVAGVGLALAMLTKSIWIILIPLWLLVGGAILLQRYFSVPTSDSMRDTPSSRRAAPNPKIVFAQICTVIACGVFLLNAGYGFEKSLRPLGQFQFISETLGGIDAHRVPGNILAFNPVSWIPCPFPANFLQGIDTQKYDFERGKLAYLNGEFQRGGWWYYYLFAFAVKAPAGYVLAVLLRCCQSGVSFGKIGLRFISEGREQSSLRLSRRFSVATSWITQWFHLFLFLVVISLVSSQTGINQGIRYLIPAFPFLYIWVGGLVKPKTACSVCQPVAAGR